MFRYFVLLCVLVFLGVSAFAQTIRYVPPENEGDKRHSYTLELLEEALKATTDTYGDFELKPSSKMNQQTSIINLTRGAKVDIIVTMTNPKLEEILLPIRVPIFKGLIGKRLMLVHKKFGGILNDVDEKAIKNIQMVQGKGWTDTEILRDNGYNVQESLVYSNIFGQLDSDEPLLFPRAVHEIWDELDVHQDLIVLPNVYLDYPTALYFFVNKNNDKLAKRIEEGLLKLIGNGTFDNLINLYLGDKLEKAKLQNRTQIKLENKTLPEKTPLKVKKLWYSTVKSD